MIKKMMSPPPPTPHIGGGAYSITIVCTSHLVCTSHPIQKMFSVQYLLRESFSLIQWPLGFGIRVTLIHFYCLWLCSLAIISTGRVDLWFCGVFRGFYVQDHPEAQPAVVQVLKSLRRRGHGLKSHPTDWEKP